MISCDDARAALLLGETDEQTRGHLADCLDCATACSGLGALAESLAEGLPDGPPPGLRERLLRTAEPLLREQGASARRARALAGLRLCAAPALALALLPLVLYVHVSLVAGLYALLSAVLPRGLDLYLAGTYAIFLASLLAFTYGALPLLLARQRRPGTTFGGRLHA